MDFNGILVLLKKRIEDKQSVDHKDVIDALISLKRMMYPHHENFYQLYLSDIFMSLFNLCHDPLPDIARNSQQYLYQLSVRFIPIYLNSDETNIFLSLLKTKTSNVHAIIALLHIWTRVIKYLSLKNAQLLCIDLFPLFNDSVSSCNSVVYSVLTRKMYHIMKLFSKKKENDGISDEMKKSYVKKLIYKVTSTEFDTYDYFKLLKTLSYPNFVEYALQKIDIKIILKYTRELPCVKIIPNFPNFPTFSQLSNYLNVENVFPLFSYLEKVPEDKESIEMQHFLDIIGSLILKGLQTKFDLVTLFSQDGWPDFCKAKLLNCLSSFVIANGTTVEIEHVFKDAISSSTNNSYFPSFLRSLKKIINLIKDNELLDLVISVPMLNYERISLAEVTIEILCKINFNNIIFKDKKSAAIERLISIVSMMDKVDKNDKILNSFCVNAKYFNNGKTLELFEKLADLFDISSKNCLNIFLCLSNVFKYDISFYHRFLNDFKEISASSTFSLIVSHTVDSITKFLRSIYLFAKKSAKSVKFSNTAAFIPIVVFRLVTGALTDDWELPCSLNTYNDLTYTVLRSNFAPFVDLFASLDIHQLIVLRDLSIRAITALQPHFDKKFEFERLHLMASKTAFWSTSEIWNFLDERDENFITSPLGLLSIDSKISISSFLKLYRSFETLNIDQKSPKFKQFSIFYEYKCHSELSPVPELNKKFVENLDLIFKGSPFPQNIVSAFAKNKKMVIFIKYHYDLPIVKELIETALEDWPLENENDIIYAAKFIKKTTLFYQKSSNNQLTEDKSAFHANWSQIPLIWKKRLSKVLSFIELD